MKYFNNITSFEDAKNQYRKLAKLLHPDKGGSPKEFQKMQQEYQVILLRLQSKVNTPSNCAIENADIINELTNLAKTLLRNKIHQRMLNMKVANTQSPFEKKIYSEIIKLIDGFA